MNERESDNQLYPTTQYVALLKAITAVSANLNTPALLTELARQLTHTFQVTSVHISDWNPDTNLATVLAEYRSPEANEQERHSDIGVSYDLFNEVKRDATFLQTRYPLLLHVDHPETPLWDQQHLAAYNIQTSLVVPMRLHDQIIGFAELWESRHRREYTPAEIELCQGIAQQGAIALVNARLYETESRRRREAETLLEIAGYLSGTLELNEVLARSLDAARRYLINISSCSISILSEDGRTLRTAAEWSEDPLFSLVPIGQEVLIDETLFSRLTLKNRQSTAVADLWQIAYLNERAIHATEGGLRALLYVPLVFRERAIGLLHFHVWHQARHFTPDEIALCQSVAHQAAIAIANANLYTAQTRQLKMATMLQKVGALLTTSLTLQQVYEHVFDYLAEIIEYDFVSLHLEDPYSDSLLLAASRGFEDAEKLREFLNAHAESWLRRIPMPPGWAFVGNTWQDTGWLVLPTLDGVCSWIGATLTVKDQLIGILSLESRESGKYNAEAAETVAAFANQAAIAIANARLHDQVLQQAAELSILHQLSIATAPTFDVDELLHRTTRMITDRLYPDVFGFVMKDPTTGKLQPHASFHGIPDHYLEQPVLYESLIGLAAHTSEPQIVPDVRREPLYDAGIPVENMHSAIVVPVLVKGQVVGVIDAESPRLNAFSERDLHFLVTLAGQVAAVIERTRLYETLVSDKDMLEVLVNQRTAELQAERDRTVAILESAGEGIILTDTAVNILYMNQAMERMSGYGRAELTGRNLRVLVNDRAARFLFVQTWPSGFSHERWSGELLNQRKDGHTYSVRLTVTPIKDNAGNVTGYVIMQSDISQLKTVERLKAEFISNVTHDLRTPLTVIKTHISLLERGKPENHPRYFHVLRQETDRLNRMIQDLLELSRLDAEFTPDPEATTDLWSLLNELQDYFGGSVAEKGLRWVMVGNVATVTAVHIHQAHLRAILTNVIDNAIKFSPPGGEVRITVQPQTRAGRSFALVTITDQGPGLNQAEQQQIFDRFFRGEAARAANDSGMGLGLPVAKKIIEPYGGLIEVQSKIGAGASFSLWLPQFSSE